MSSGESSWSYSEQPTESTKLKYYGWKIELKSANGNESRRGQWGKTELEINEVYVRAAHLRGCGGLCCQGMGLT